MDPTVYTWIHSSNHNSRVEWHLSLSNTRAAASSSPSTLPSFRPLMHETARGDTSATLSVQPCALRAPTRSARTLSSCAPRGAASSCLPSRSLDVGAQRPSSSCDSSPAAEHGPHLPTCVRSVGAAMVWVARLCSCQVLCSLAVVAAPPRLC